MQKEFTFVAYAILMGRRHYFWEPRPKIKGGKTGDFSLISIERHVTYLMIRYWPSHKLAIREAEGWDDGSVEWNFFRGDKAGKGIPYVEFCGPTVAIVEANIAMAEKLSSERSPPFDFKGKSLFEQCEIKFRAFEEYAAAAEKRGKAEAFEAERLRLAAIRKLPAAAFSNEDRAMETAVKGMFFSVQYPSNGHMSFLLEKKSSFAALSAKLKSPDWQLVSYAEQPCPSELEMPDDWALVNVKMRPRASKGPDLTYVYAAPPSQMLIEQRELRDGTPVPVKPKKNLKTRTDTI